MSSRSQTKSLDRDIINNKKKKVYYPQNVQKVNNAAEHIVCHFHNQIEEIFSHYQVKKFSKDILTEKINEIIEKRLNIDCEVDNIIKEISHIDENDELFEILSQYLDFVLITQKLLKGINSKLIQTIVCGLIRYCVSLASYCTSEISFVVNYEKLIQRNSPEIIKEVRDVEEQVVNFKKNTFTTRSALLQRIEVVDCVSKIRASINKLYYLVTEWVDEERIYPTNLSEEIKLVKSQIFSTQQKTDFNRGSLTRRQGRLVNLEKHISILKKNQRILKQKHRRVNHSRQQIESMLDQLTEQDVSQVSELVAMNKKVNRLEHLQISMEIHAAKSDQRDLKSKHFRMYDNKLALCRHRDRLMKVDLDMCQKVEAAKQEITAHELAKNKLLSDLQADLDVQNSDLKRLKELQPILDDLNFLYSKKNSPETMRQLRNHGRLIMENKELDFIDKMFEKVASSVPERWREIYLNLPFHPPRSKDQRSKDIETIDLLSARNDNTPVNQAQMSLNKWRLFFHNATPDHLIEGLKKTHLTDIAKEIENLYFKSKNRYEED